MSQNPCTFYCGRKVRIIVVCYEEAWNLTPYPTVILGLSRSIGSKKPSQDHQQLTRQKDNEDYELSTTNSFSVLITSLHFGTTSSYLMNLSRDLTIQVTNASVIPLII